MFSEHFQFFLNTSNEADIMVYDVIIIGSGPAGFSASIYTSRAHLKTLQFEGEQP